MKVLLFVVLIFFFFKQKTAYEIGWCDWSSDVCSSDLSASWTPAERSGTSERGWCTRSEERRVGKDVPSSVDLGGRRIIKKKKKEKKYKNEASIYEQRQRVRRIRI